MVTFYAVMVLGTSRWNKLVGCLGLAWLTYLNVGKAVRTEENDMQFILKNTANCVLLNFDSFFGIAGLSFKKLPRQHANKT